MVVALRIAYAVCVDAVLPVDESRLFRKCDLSFHFEITADRRNPGAGLTSADGDCVLALRDHDVSRLGDHADVAAIQTELDLLTGARLEVNALKSAQRANRCSGRVGKTQVQLHDFIARELARIGYR